MSKAKQGAVKTLADAGYVAVATAGTTATALMQIMAQKGPDLAAGDLTLSALSGFTVAGSSIFASKLANRFTDSTADNVAKNDELLRNGDWMKLSALTASELIREYAAHDEELSEVESDSLLDLADAVQADWEEMASSYGTAYQQLDKAKAITWFRQASSYDSEQRRALDPDMWQKILTEVGQNNACLPNDLLVLTLGVYLRDQYAQAIYRLLKDDEEADRAFRGLLLSTLSTVHEAVCDRLPTMIDELQEANAETQNQVGNIGVAIDLATYQILESMPAKVDLEPVKKQLREQNERWNEVVKNLAAAEIILVENQAMLFHVNEKQNQQLSDQQKILALLEQLKAFQEQHQVSVVAGNPKTLVNSIPARISNISNQMNIRRTFIPRGKLMSKLRRRLKMDRHSAVTQTTKIHGGGGVGKTQLALEYVLKYKDEFEIAWWIRAEEPQTIIEDLYELGMELGFEENKEKPRVARNVKSKIEKLNNWVLIFDNAESTEAVCKWLPNSQNGATIVTSRNRDWNKQLGSVAVDKMDEGQAVRLLLKRSGQKDQGNAKEVARRLGYLPLALEIAAAFCSQANTTLEDYLTILRERGIEALDKIKPEDYDALISETWQPSFEAAIKQEPAAEKVLAILSFVDADNFPIELLGKEIEDKLALENAIRALRSFSLVERNDNQLSIHRLVQDAYRYQMSMDVYVANLAIALKVVHVLEIGLQQTDLAAQKSFGVLYPHIASVSNHGSKFLARFYKNPPSDLHEIPRPIYSLLGVMHNDLSVYQQLMAQFAEAEPFARRALEINEQAIGQEHSDIATCLNNLAQLLKATNRLREAEPLMRRALAIDERAFGQDHPRIAIRLNNLASLLKATNRLQEAEPLMRRALMINERAFGQNHPEVAAVLSTLASLLFTTNRLQEAEPLMRRALMINEQAFDKNHPDVATDLNNLAILLLATNRRQEAEPLLRRALTIDERAFGQDHPNVARDLRNLASLLKATNRLPESEPLMRRALVINEQAFGNNHPEVAISLNNLALLLLTTNRLQEAEPLMRRHLTILAVFTRNTGHEHPHFQTAIQNYSGLLEEMGLSAKQIKERITAALDVDSLE